MTAFRIAICEDDQTSREYEKELINKWSEISAIRVQTDTFTSSENFLFESEDRLEYDLLILDIQMGKMNGFELAKILRKRGFSGSLIFLTGIKDYAIDGYEVSAARYLLKPIKEEDLFNTLSFLYKDFNNKKEEVFLLQCGNEIDKIEYSKIIYIEARGHYLYLSSTEEGLCRQWKASFSSLEDKLQKKDFFCLRRGLLVNLDHVEKITRTECILDTKEIIPVARGKYKELNEAFINHYKKNGGF